MAPKKKTFDPLGDTQDGHILTRAIIDTIHEPLVVLDEELRIIVASESFYRKFNLDSEKTQGRMFYNIEKGLWNIPAFRLLLGQVISKSRTIQGYEVEHDFPVFGRRLLLVNARRIQYGGGKDKMLLSIFDVTEQRTLEQERERLLAQKDLLLKEMRHRIANSLQLIASILLLKAGVVQSEESRTHLHEAHERIMSIATVQQQLDPVVFGDDIEVAGYLTALCKSLERSMIGARKPITLKVVASKGSVSSDIAISFGLITTELVINALKHAFLADQKGDIVVRYDLRKKGWTLSIEDNGIGSRRKKKSPRGLGTSIIGALANQLHAIIRTSSTKKGTRVSIIHNGI